MFDKQQVNDYAGGSKSAANQEEGAQLSPRVPVHKMLRAAGQLMHAEYRAVCHAFNFSLSFVVHAITCTNKFYYHQKAAIDIIENIPTKYKEKQFLLHLDTVLKIEEILK